MVYVIVFYTKMKFDCIVLYGTPCTYLHLWILYNYGN